MAKEAPNVARMKVLGAKVIPVTDGAQTLKEAVDAAFTVCTIHVGLFVTTYIQLSY